MKDREQLNSLEGSLAEREAACSKLRDDLSKRLDDFAEHERPVRRNQDEVQSERKVLAAERGEFENHKREYQQEMTLSQNVICE